MNAIAAFVIRLVVYAFVLGGSGRLAEWLWTERGLDGVLALEQEHAFAAAAVALAPAVLALIGTGPLRYVAAGIAGFLAGAVLTAPFAFARLAG